MRCSLLLTTSPSLQTTSRQFSSPKQVEPDEADDRNFVLHPIVNPKPEIASVIGCKPLTPVPAKPRRKPALPWRSSAARAERDKLIHYFEEVRCVYSRGTLFALRARAMHAVNNVRALWCRHARQRMSLRPTPLQALKQRKMFRNVQNTAFMTPIPHVWKSPPVL